MADVPLTPEELGDHLQAPVVAASATLAIRRTLTWVRRASGLTEISAEGMPEDLWADAIELAGLAYDNPTLLASETIGTTSRAWPVVQQRDEILARIGSRYKASSGGPRGSFPAAQPWPDPADCWTGFPS